MPAVAGTVYRCDSPDGSRSYGSKRVKGARCTAITSYTPKPAAIAAPAAAMSQMPAKAAPDGVPAVGSATPPVAVAGSPAALPASAAAVAPAMPASAISQPAIPAPTPTRRLVQGQVYSYIKDGVRHYTSKPPKGVAVAGATAMRTIRYSFMETCFACGLQPGVNFKTLRLNPNAYDADIRAAAQRHGVEEAIVRAIIHAESSFNPNAVSHAGAQGLMQLMPATARRFGVTNSFDPTQNIGGGVQYLAWLLKRYNGDLTLAAAGYNAGEGAVDRHKGVPPYNETRRYVERVRLLADRYRSILPGRG
jgi:soluble lytic murein transglycosylase-like protein